jgi:energy-coupling factor transport system substrate-specific component
MALLMPLLVMAALADTGGRQRDSKSLALLGVLAACTAVMRMPISFAGANLIFLLPMVCGFVFGASFGFMLGALGMCTSAVITGGIGPWLPFQMLALGWVGAGAGFLSLPIQRVGAGTKFAVAVLMVYGMASAFLYGALMDLYFWPVVSFGSAAISWSPRLGPLLSVVHFRNFYALTSLAWDSVGAISNAIIIGVLGPPIMRLLTRYKKRFTFEVDGDGFSEVGEELIPELS